MRVNGRRVVSLLLLAAVEILFAGLACALEQQFMAQSQRTEEDVKRVLYKQFEKGYTRIQNIIRTRGLAAVSPRYARWQAEQQAHGINEDVVSAPTTTGGAPDGVQKKKGWRRNRPSGKNGRKRRRWGRFGGGKGRFRNGNRKRNKENSLGRNLRGMNLTKTTGWQDEEAVDVLRSNDPRPEAVSFWDRLKNGLAGPGRKGSLRRTEQDAKKAGRTRPAERERRGERFRDATRGEERGAATRRRIRRNDAPPENNSTAADAQQRRRTQTQAERVNLFAGFLISATSPWWTDPFDDNAPIFCAGIDGSNVLDPLLLHEQWNVFDHENYRKGKTSDVELLECASADPRFYFWIADDPNGTGTVGDGQVFDGWEVYLPSLNEDDPADPLELDGWGVPQYNVWMSVDEVKENEVLNTYRMNVFDMAPRDPQRWVLNMGPDGDRTWRPFPQEPYQEGEPYYENTIGGQTYQYEKPYNRQLCAAAQKQNGTVSIGNKVLLKECEGDGKARERQAWVFCGAPIDCKNETIVPPQFTISINGEPEEGQSRSLKFWGRVTQDNIPESTLNQLENIGCSRNEKDLEQKNNLTNWGEDFQLSDLGYWSGLTIQENLNYNGSAKESVKVKITITTRCDGTANQYDLDTLFRLYEFRDNDDDLNCIRANITSCNQTAINEGKAATTVVFEDVTIRNNTDYWIAATGTDVVEVCPDFDSGIDFTCRV